MVTYLLLQGHVAGSEPVVALWLNSMLLRLFQEAMQSVPDRYLRFLFSFLFSFFHARQVYLESCGPVREFA